MTLNGVMAITLRYFTEFGKPVLQKTICGGIYARVYIVFLLSVQCRRKKSSRSLSHLLISFLYQVTIIIIIINEFHRDALCHSNMTNLTNHETSSVCTLTQSSSLSFRDNLVGMFFLKAMQERT